MKKFALLVAALITTLASSQPASAFSINYPDFSHADGNLPTETGIQINYSLGSPAIGTSINNATVHSFTTYVNTSPTTVGADVYYETYCVDLFHFLESDPSEFPATKVLLADSFSDYLTTEYLASENTYTSTYERDGFGRAAWLVNNITPISGHNQPALQLAIWKAVYEEGTAGSPLVGTGARPNNAPEYIDATIGTLNYGSSLSAGLLSDVNSYLQMSVTAGGGQYAVDEALWIAREKDTSTPGVPLYQDLIAAKVPEPSLVLLACALAPLSLLRRRKASDLA
ncbi:MAG: hypothetical protein ACKV0T_30590 [Planctomycetales bacterium]